MFWTKKINNKSKPSQGDLITALDVGTTKTCCFIARVDLESTINIVGVGHHLSRGMKSGAVVDMEAATASVRSAVDAAERMAGEVVHEAYINFSAGKQLSKMVSVEVPVTGNQVTDSDIQRSIEKAMLNSDDEEREIIHAIPVQYSIGGVTGIRDPRGMYGTSLGVKLHIVTAESGHARNLAICTGRGHLEVRGLVASGFASGLATLVEDEAELGATVIDMGGGITTISVFSEGSPVLVESVPLGGQHITNDIARALSSSLSHAERIKTLYGTAVGNEGDARELIDIPPVGETDRVGTNHVPRSEITNIISPRIEELFELVLERLSSAGTEEISGRRVVLTGGGSQLDGANEIAARILNKQVRIGRPVHVEGLAEATGGGAFATCAGMLTYAASGLANNDVGIIASFDRGGSSLANIGRWLRENL